MQSVGAQEANQKGMTAVEQLARFVERAGFESLSEEARQRLKICVLDALGCAICSLDSQVPRLVRRQVEEFGGAGLCTLIGGGRSSPDRATFYNGTLIRYLDFNDSFLAAGETCHPSDNLAPVLAASEYANCSGKQLLAALAVAYQIHCRLCEMAPVRARGFDHTTQGAYAAAGGAAKALDLPGAQIASAIAISGTAFNSLRVTRTGRLSNWKGLAYPNTAFGAIHAVFLARLGITGPLEVFEGNKGFQEAIAGPFKIDWLNENLDRVKKVILKRFNAEAHSQSAIEGLLELKREHSLEAADVERIEVETFNVAHQIIGGGEEGDKTIVSTKEQADHSLPYLLAVALLDGKVMPEQFLPERIQREDVQKLLRKITIRPTPEFTLKFPDQMACRLIVFRLAGPPLIQVQRDYEGFHTRPMGWDTAVEKFRSLTSPLIEESLQELIFRTIYSLEAQPVSLLASLLSRVGANGKNKEIYEPTDKAAR